MAKIFLPDTDVLIDFLRGYNQAIDFIHTRSPQIILSVIVVAELYAGVKGKKESAVLLDCRGLGNVERCWYSKFYHYK